MAFLPYIQELHGEDASEFLPPVCQRCRSDVNAASSSENEEVLATEENGKHREIGGK